MTDCLLYRAWILAKGCLELCNRCPRTLNSQIKQPLINPPAPCQWFFVPWVHVLVHVFRLWTINSTWTLNRFLATIWHLSQRTSLHHSESCYGLFEASIHICKFNSLEIVQNSTANRSWVSHVVLRNVVNLNHQYVVMCGLQFIHEKIGYWLCDCRWL